MKGRKPRPSYLKSVEGNPGKRKLPKNEPKPRRVIPSPPDHLSKEEAVAWGRFASWLDRAGVITELDSPGLERICGTYVEVVSLQADIRKNGRTQVVKTKSDDDFERQRPQVQMLQDADRRLRAWLVEFGMTPSSRTRVQRVGDDEDRDPAEEYFN